MKMYVGVKLKLHAFLNLSTRWTRPASVTLQSLYLWEKSPPVSIGEVTVWVPEAFWHCF